MSASGPFLIEFARRFLILALGVGLLGAFFFTLQVQRQEHLRRVDAQSLVATERQIFLDTLDMAVADSRFLAALFRDHVPRPDGMTPVDHRQTSLLFSFMRTRPHFFQLRYLTPDGLEVLRLERRDNIPVLVDPHQLQDKSHRPYYYKTAFLDFGKTYISDLDLNTEQGRVQRPFQPTFRVATPVPQTHGPPGIAVINFNGSQILEQLRSAGRNAGVRLYLVNNAGHWILGPDQAMQWGNSLPERGKFTLEATFPQLSKRLEQSTETVFQTGQGLFVTARIDPAALPTMGNRVSSTQLWTLVAHVPTAALRPDWTIQFHALAVLTLLMLAAASAHLTRSSLRRLRMERHLQETEEKIRAISHSSHDALIMVDDQGCIAFWNPAAETMLGYAAHEVLGRPAREVLTPGASEDPSDVPALRAGPFNDAHCDQALRLQRRNGERFPAEVALSSFRLHGRWWTVNAVRDITQRTAALDDLAKSREMLMEAQSISRMGGFSVLVASGEMFWTEEMRSLHGVDAHFIPSLEAMGQFVELAARGKFIQAFQEARKGNPVEQELPLRTAAGRRVWVRATLRAHYSGETVSRISGIYQDVTDRRLERLRLEQLSTAVEHSPASVVIADAEFNLEYVNTKFTEVTGYTAPEIIGHNLTLLQSEMHEAPFYRQIRETITRGQDWSGEVGTRARSGRLIWQQVSVSPILDEQDRVQHIVAVMEDVTERRLAVEALQASERKVRAMSEAMLDAMVVVDSNSLISFWNPAAQRIFGYTEEEARGRDVHDLIADPADTIGIKEGMRRFSKNGDGPVVGATRELTARRKDGAQFPCEITVSSFSLDQQWYAVGTIRDITRRKQYEQQLRDLATTDELTGLANRRALLQQAEAELDRAKRYGRPFSLLMLDLDHFKRVNDTYGHDVGDKVLEALARSGEKALRDSDVLGRLGGEEFAAILPETTAEKAREVAERLREGVGRVRVEEPSAPDGAVQVTISVGVAEFNEQRPTVDAVLKAADKALYQAKETGRNRTVVAS